MTDAGFPKREFAQSPSSLLTQSADRENKSRAEIVMVYRIQRGCQSAPVRAKKEELMAVFSCAPTSSPLKWRTRLRIPIILAVVALVLSGCNANQAVNLSGQADRCANDTACNPYNPSSYAQNNTGIGR